MNLSPSRAAWLAAVTCLVGTVPTVASAQPFMDTELFTAPVGVPSANGGPTERGEISITREQFFETTAPDMTGSGVTLTPADTDRDGLFSQSIFVRTGPVVDNSRDPESEAAIVFPPSVTVIGVVVSTSALNATDATWGLAPAVDYTASSRGMEVTAVEYARIIAGPGGTTIVELRTNMLASPYTDEFRILIDHGTAWVPNLVAGVRVVTGDDVNIGGADGGRTGSPTGYLARLPLTHGCGDGIVGPMDECDDGNTRPDDGCSATCTIEPGYTCTGEPSVCTTRCGDGVIAGSEECDDRNTTDGDGCSSSCEVEPGYMCVGMASVCTEVCGDGRIVGSEECDDRNMRDGDGCNSMCEIEPGFMCTGEPSTCEPVCGDGVLAPGEGCDDSNLIAGDGCSAMCAVEPGYMCVGEPSVCDEVCGDGRIVGAEECDDRNTTDGDGCSAMCEVEGGFVCTGTPSICGVCVDTATGDGTDLGCEMASPICVGSGATAFCAPCINDSRAGTDTGCMDTAPVCDTSSPPAHICLSCEDTAGGAGVDHGCDAATPVCGTAATGAPACFECTADDHCGAGTVCGPAGTCVPGCDDNSDCAGTPETPVCETSGRVCVECLDASHCMGTEICGSSNSCEAPDTDGDGTPDDVDLDDDNDGIPDTSEIDGSLVGDSDGDGILDFEDASIVTCPDTSPMDGVCDELPENLDFDGDGIANHLDLDADGDGIADIIEGGGDDTDGDARVDSYMDANGDGLHDAYAAMPLPLPNSDGADDGPDFLDIDADNDGVTDTHEGGGTDVDMDGAPDDATDANGDGIADGLTGSGALPIPDTDADGTPDYQDPDDDGDSILTRFEGPIAQDTDRDGIPDYLDPDDDGDGIPTIDEAPDANGDGDPADARDSDGDGTVDYLDPDGVIPADGGPTADGGPAGGADGGDGADGGVDPTSGGVSGGALCRAAPGRGTPGPWLLLLAAGVALTGRGLRRRR